MNHIHHRTLRMQGEGVGLCEGARRFEKRHQKGATRIEGVPKGKVMLMILAKRLQHIQRCIIHPPNKTILTYSEPPQRRNCYSANSNHRYWIAAFISLSPRPTFSFRESFTQPTPYRPPPHVLMWKLELEKGAEGGGEDGSSVNRIRVTPRLIPFRSCGPVVPTSKWNDIHITWRNGDKPGTYHCDIWSDATKYGWPLYGAKEGSMNKCFIVPPLHNKVWT